MKSWLVAACSCSPPIDPHPRSNARACRSIRRSRSRTSPTSRRRSRRRTATSRSSGCAIRPAWSPPRSWPSRARSAAMRSGAWPSPRRMQLKEARPARALCAEEPGGAQAQLPRSRRSAGLCRHGRLGRRGVLQHGRGAEARPAQAAVRGSTCSSPTFKGKITMPHPASSGTGYFHVSAWIQMFGEDKAWAFMDRLHDNIAFYVAFRLAALPHGGGRRIPGRHLGRDLGRRRAPARVRRSRAC